MGEQKTQKTNKSTANAKKYSSAKKSGCPHPPIERIVIKQYDLILLHAFYFVKSSKVVPIDNIEWCAL